jgi:hypothetical protein
VIIASFLQGEDQKAYDELMELVNTNRGNQTEAKLRELSREADQETTFGSKGKGSYRAAPETALVDSESEYASDSIISISV